jgi:cell division transport system permease protein
MFIKRSYIQHFPLNQEIGKSHLAWTVGLLTVLMVLVLIGFLALYTPNLSSSQQTFTIEIPTVEDSIQSESVTKKILNVLENFPTFKEAKVIEKEQLISLLDPSLVAMDGIKDLRFPIFIDATFENSPLIDLKSLTHQLRQIVAGIHVEPHNRWQNMVNATSRAAQTLGVVLVSFIFAIMMMVISLVTRATLVAYHPIVDSLRLMGAKNAFIASQFQKQAFKSSLLGGTLGLFVGIVLIYFLKSLPHFLGLPILFLDFFTFKTLLYFLILPFGIALFSIIVARLTVARLLYLLEK